MKRVILLNICLLMILMLHATVEKTVDVSAGGSLSSVLSETELSTVTHLTIRGTIDARDFKTMRDNMDHLTSLDISAVVIEGYSGTSGTNESGLITFPVNTIPEYAFYNPNRNNGKTALSTIVLPSSASAIGDFSFCGCRGLTSIVIPSTVLSIGNRAFQYCSKLSSLTFRPISNLSIIGDYAFDSCTGLAGVLTIPSSVTLIGVGAFRYCSNFTSLTFEMPSRIDAIENSAFESCSELAGSLMIPSSVKTIGKNAFYGCSHFTLVANSSLGASLGGGVSYNCKSLISLDSYPTHPINITSSANAYKNVDNPFLKGASSTISTSNEQSGGLLYLDESPYFTLSFSRTTVAASSNSKAVVEVKSNISWTAVSDKAWLSVSQGTTGNGTLTLTASANPSIITRAATVTVSGPGVAAQTIKVTQAGLIQVTISSPSVTLSKIYDGNNLAVVAPGVLSGVAEADATDVEFLATGTYDDEKVGTGKTITVKYKLTGSANSEYAAPADFILAGDIVPKELTVTGVHAMDKVYDGNSIAQVTGLRLEGVISSDIVNLKCDTIGTFAQTHTGENITVKLRKMALSGADAGNYVLIQPDDPKANITSRILTVSGTVVHDKVYDGKTTALISSSMLQGVVPTDDVSLVVPDTATFAQADKGVNIPVTISLMKLKGADSDNYVLQQPSGFFASITARPLIVTGAVARDKIYDGNDLAQITGATLEGVVYPDDVMLSNQRIGQFAQKEKGERIKVSSGMTLVGADANNYTLVQPSGLSADITPKPLTVSGAVAQDKIYDGTAIAQISGANLEGVISPDIVSLVGSGVFSQKEVGVAIRITGMIITGKDSANYVLVLPEYLKANILPRTLTVSGATAQDKIYDGNNIARVTGASLNGVVNSDDVSLTGTGAFSQKQVGEHVRVTDLLITGRDAGNYKLAQPEGLSANIIAKPLTIRGTFAYDKIYDGTTTAQIGGSQLEGVITTDDVTLVEQSTGTFAQKDKGINIPVSILPMTITGADSENYTLLQPEGLSANIIAKQLTISAPSVINHKMVDGNTNAVITDIGRVEGVVAADVNNVNVSATANYDNANVGNNKTITVVYVLGGNAMSNYKAPADYVMSAARISDYITLAPISTPTAGCEGYDLDLTYTVLTGSPTQYKITFDQTAISAGLQNISYRDLSSSGNTGVLAMAIPSGMPDGTYTATLQMHNELGAESIPYSFSFTINLSTDYVVPKFDDMLICDNSSNRFRAYQWYKNGIAIEGATSQFYTDTEGLVGDYSLKVWTVDGQELLTCSKSLDIPLNSKKLVSVYPNPLKQSTQNSTVEISGFSEKELQGAQMTVYDIKGIPVYATGSLTRVNTLRLPHVVGFYVGRITFAGGKEHMFKILVTE